MKFVIKQNVLEIENCKNFCSGTINCLKIDIEFDAAWDGLTKEAIIIKEFETEGERIAIVNDQICISRPKKGKYFIGFIGYRLEENKKVFQLSTNLEAISYDKGAGEVEAKEAEELPTPTQWEIYINEIQKVINEANTLDIDLQDNVLTITKKDGTKHSEYVKGEDYILTNEDIEEIASKVVIPDSNNINIENGEGENSFQQKAEVETWTSVNETVKSFIDQKKGLADDPTITIVSNGYNVKVGAYGKSSTMLHGKGQALGNKTHTEGSKCIAFENNTHAEGNETFAGGKHSHSEGTLSVALGNASHSEGNQTKALGDNSHSEGAYTKAQGVSSHAEGHKTEANKEYTHAEGFYSQANGPYSHAEGHRTYANGYYSHSEGNDTHAIGGASHCEGQGTYADGNHSLVTGKYNKRDVYENTETPIHKYARIVGIGTSDSDRKNGYTLDWNGNGWFAGSLTINGNNKVAIEGQVTALEKRIKALEDKMK